MPAFNRRSFDSISKIIEHIRGPFKHMVWIGNDYSVADLSRDLERIDRENLDELTDLEESECQGLVETGADPK